MIPLPIDQQIPSILSRIRQAGRAVIVAPPGAGKTTRLPPALLNAGLLDSRHPNLVMLQPRRIAARAAARRIAEEQGWELGGRVGYHVRFDRVMGPATRLRVLTEGILTRQLLGDPFLEGIGAVVLDEFHERSISTDLAIALLREVRQTVRPDLILVVMSATLDAEPVARFLDDCPIVRVESSAFAVRIDYSLPSGLPLPERVVEAMEGAEGDVLVFLPGADEIRRTLSALQPIADRQNMALLPLHGSLPAEEQDRALRPDPQGRRRVILATNVAETSLTVPGVRTVIDSGLARIAGYDAGRGLDRLDLKPISRASATQRAGRAGRQGPGVCIRLWTAKEEAERIPFEEPEIARVDLAATVLELHAWGRDDPRQFNWFSAPPESALAAAERLLTILGALDGGKITPLGRRMATLPLHPRLARLLIAACDAGLARSGAALAAILSERDLVRADDRPALTGRSDLLVRMDMLNADPRRYFSVTRVADDLYRLSRQITGSRHTIDSDEETSLLKLILFAYPDRVARRRQTDPRSAIMTGGKGLRIAAESVVHDAEFFVAVDARQDDRSSKSEALVRIASAIEAQWLEEMFPKSISRRQSVEFDPQRGRIVGSAAICYLDLIIRQHSDVPVDAEIAGTILADALRPQATEWFAADEAAAAILARLDLLRRYMPEKSWPLFDAAALGDLLAEACQGKRTTDEVRRQPPANLLRSRLVYPLDRLLDQEAPESLLVPSGSRIPVKYEPGRPPVLAVRLQEIFGWTDTPRLTGGRAAVVLHLLGPNFRPVQVTDDLRSFWKTAYFEVRKDLRRRYPKHSWPDDPLTAAPQAKGRPRRPQ